MSTRVRVPCDCHCIATANSNHGGVSHRACFCVVQTVRYLHEDLRMVHRDLKPSNILVTAKMVVKLCDVSLRAVFGCDLRRHTHKCKPTNANPQMQMHKCKCTNANTQRCICSMGHFKVVNAQMLIAQSHKTSMIDTQCTNQSYTTRHGTHKHQHTSAKCHVATPTAIASVKTHLHANFDSTPHYLNAMQFGISAVDEKGRGSRPGSLNLGSSLRGLRGSSRSTGVGTTEYMAPECFEDKKFAHVEQLMPVDV